MTWTCWGSTRRVARRLRSERRPCRACSRRPGRAATQWHRTVRGAPRCTGCRLGWASRRSPGTHTGCPRSTPAACETRRRWRWGRPSTARVLPRRGAPASAASARPAPQGRGPRSASLVPTCYLHPGSSTCLPASGTPSGRSPTPRTPPGRPAWRARCRGAAVGWAAASPAARFSARPSLVTRGLQPPARNPPCSPTALRRWTAC
mmetsp:Transcript_15759/g.41731  ORF Transcript_15759/g.41731 Transcript_15759/m.41731 type:complete len:205 (+) Transcript_15759:975-1589(+)